jgi:threonine aldolase
MRQAGVLAAAELYALDHHVDRLADDHDNARRLANELSTLKGFRFVGEHVETNIVFVDVSNTCQSASEIATVLLGKASALAPFRIMFCAPSRTST